MKKIFKFGIKIIIKYLLASPWSNQISSGTGRTVPARRHLLLRCPIPASVRTRCDFLLRITKRRSARLARRLCRRRPIAAVKRPGRTGTSGTRRPAETLRPLHHFLRATHKRANETNVIFLEIIVLINKHALNMFQSPER